MTIEATDPLSTSVLREDGFWIGIYRTREEILPLRDFWTSCEAIRDADFEFFLSVAQATAGVVCPLVFVLYQDGKPIALLASRLEEGRLPIMIGPYRLMSVRVRQITVVHGGWLGVTTRHIADRLVAAVVERMRLGEAVVAKYHSAPLNASIGQAVVQCTLSVFRQAVVSQLHWFIDVQPGQLSFIEKLSSNERYQQRKRRKQIDAEFGDKISFQCFTSVDDIPALIGNVEKVARASYQRGLGVGFEDTPLTRHRLTFEAERGWLRGHVLMLGGNPAAFWIGSLRNKVYLSDYLGYHPAYAKWSPGLYMVTRVIDELYTVITEERVRTIDFGIGDATYKSRLGNRAREEADVHVFAPSANGLALAALLGASSLVGAWGKRLAARADVLDSIRRLRRARSRAKVSTASNGERLG